MLNKNCDTEKADAFTTAKHHKRSPSPFDSRDTQIEIVMAEKRDENSITSRQQLEMTRLSKSIVKLQKVAPINLKTPEDC